MYKKGCWNEEQDEQWKKKCDKNVKFSLILNSANKFSLIGQRTIGTF